MERSFVDENRVRQTVDNYRFVLDRVREAAVKSGRGENDVRLMCVTKTVEPAYINPVLDDGADLIGENRVQEFLGKKAELHLENVESHLIGHLQTNKVKQIAGEVDLIQSVDSVKLAKEISRVSKLRDITTNILVEINVGKEDSKSGVYIEGVDELVGEIAELENVRIKGLMTIPPICDESEAKKYFAVLRRAFEDFKSKKADNIDMQILSMGMSGDYEAAISEGSNLVRVGSAIFGARKYI